MPVPELRRRTINQLPINKKGNYVLYWMIAFRRPFWNHALQHAVDLAVDLKRPLLVFEPLRIRYQWASDRLHRFVIEGMRDNADAFRNLPVTYFPYVEPKAGAGTPLLRELAEKACVVVTDEYPCFFLPRMVNLVRNNMPCRMDQVDSNGILPLRLADRTFTVAHSYRRWMQKQIRPHLEELATANPLEGAPLETPVPVPSSITKRWPAADFESLLDRDGLQSLDIDHEIKQAAFAGGWQAAQHSLREFLKQGLEDYDEARNQPDEHGSTGLSPYLHFGHISADQIVTELLEAENWNPGKMAEKANGKNHDFWGTSVSAEALLDQILTWREIGFNKAFREPESYTKFESLPDWAVKTLKEHQTDQRPHLYSLEEFESAKTHDELWNAAQTQLVREGRMHNYMRMLWGKKILHWTKTPREALQIMVELNNKYAVDGRDPNSYSGIFWTLGRYDRAWGPKREVFGSVRYMTSDSTRRKLRLEQYLRKYSR